jgi:hypothetical protein
VCAAEQNKLSNVINDPRARVGSMREKNDHKNSAPDNEHRPDNPDRSLSISGEPAPIDIAAFGKRLGEIISKALRASRKRHKSRKYGAASCGDMRPTRTRGSPTLAGRPQPLNQPQANRPQAAHSLRRYVGRARSRLALPPATPASHPGCRLAGADPLAGEHMERECGCTRSAAGMLGKS